MLEVLQIIVRVIEDGIDPCHEKQHLQVTKVFFREIPCDFSQRLFGAVQTAFLEEFVITRQGPDHIFPVCIEKIPEHERLVLPGKVGRVLSEHIEIRIVNVMLLVVFKLG